MQTFFSNFVKMLSDWFSLISNNSLYSAIVAVSVAIILVSAIVGLIMSARCRAKNSQLLLALNDLETREGRPSVENIEGLGETKNIIQSLKLELSDKDKLVGQMEKDMQNMKERTEYTNELEEHINQRNEQIFQIVDSLETDFGLGDSQELPLVDDVWAESLWNRHSELMTHLRGRMKANAMLQNNQSGGQSFDDMAKKDAIIAELTQTLEKQSSLITKLENDLEAQKHTMQESLLKAQAHSSEIEATQEKTLARISELEKELLEAKKSAVEKVVVIVQQIPQQIMHGLDEIAFKPFMEQIERLKQTAGKQSQHAVESISSHVIKPAVNTYHSVTENMNDLPEMSMQALQRQSEGLKKWFVNMKDSAAVGDAVIAVKHRILPAEQNRTAKA